MAQRLVSDRLFLPVRGPALETRQCLALHVSRPQRWANVTVSEDCLFLNVATPNQQRVNKQLLPVMVYIHGGGFMEGSSSYSDPAALVAQSNHSIVAVTMNYRLSAFGFLRSPLHHTQNRDGRGDKHLAEYGGNIGIEDQRLALRWVKDNIEAFGGDSTLVTILGESGN